MKTFIQTRRNSFRYAFSGVVFVLRTQRNSWIHLAISILVIAIGVFLGLSILDWAVLIFCIALVWICEFFNTSIEVIVDMVSPSEHPLAKISKDVAAGAVLVAAICSVVIGALILGPPLYQKIFTIP